MLRTLGLYINKSRDNEATRDAGTVGRFLRPVAPVDGIKPTEEPIEIEMPNGNIEKALICDNVTKDRHIRRAGHTGMNRAT